MLLLTGATGTVGRALLPRLIADGVAASSPHWAPQLGASTGSRARLMRAKAMAERAVVAASLQHTGCSPSIIYAPGDPYLSLPARMSRLRAIPIPGSGCAGFEPICADDVAGCVLAALPGGTAGARQGPQINTVRPAGRIVWDCVPNLGALERPRDRQTPRRRYW